MIAIPTYVGRVLEHLRRAGYEAFCVGGCVRDSLIGRVPEDWDVTTSALPTELMTLFDGGGFRPLPTGLSHGTVTVLSDGAAVEVTTYRVDGEYVDCRRPTSVSFTASLTDDLARRDFTINAMAYSDYDGLCDPYGGRRDLEAGLLRCVGEPNKRFSEDALRILRAMRFASVLGFSIEPATSSAMLEQRCLLDKISRERVSAELSRLLCGEHAADVLERHEPILRQLLPGAALDADLLLELRGEPLTTLLAALSPEEGELRRLRFDNRTCSRVALLLRERERRLESRLDIKRLCRDVGLDAARELLRLRRDTAAERMLDELCAADECMSLAQLAIGGRELLTLGVQPSRIGAVLAVLLEAVMEGRAPNERNALESYISAL